MNFNDLPKKKRGVCECIASLDACLDYHTVGCMPILTLRGIVYCR